MPTVILANCRHKQPFPTVHSGESQKNQPIADINHMRAAASFCVANSRQLLPDRRSTPTLVAIVFGNRFSFSDNPAQPVM